MTQVTFYFDLGSPFAYLAAERMSEILPEPVAWQPVSLGGLFKLTGRSSWALREPDRRQAGMAEVERRAQQYGLPAVRWPDPWPTNYLFAMRVATFAFQVGRGREFTMQAFRHAFQHGHDLGVHEHVLQTADEVGLDPDTVRDAADEAEVKLALRSATDTAHELGVFGVPTIAVADEPFWGDDRLRDTATALVTMSSGSDPDLRRGAG
jgi:2-hydroxychromene-2-carboxylate isomerase